MFHISNISKVSVGSTLILAILMIGIPSVNENGDAFAGDVDRHSIQIPEPMIFDLVRELGVKKGEFEANTLFRYKDFDELDWAPEVEYGVVDGFAVEFELPFDGTTLEAYKFAAQYTFESGTTKHFVHGTQAIAEYKRQDRFWQWTLLYIPAFRLTDTWSALLMLGTRFKTGSDDRDTEAVINASLFADLSENSIVGLETNLAAGGEQGTAWVLMPQLHYGFTEHFMLQIGAGASRSNRETVPEISSRLIYLW